MKGRRSIKTTRYRNGTVCWIDLGTPDMESTVYFYASLFGWTVDEPDPTGYRLCRLEGHLVAAFGPAEDDGAPYWTVNFHTDNIDVTVGQISRLGAEIVVTPVVVDTLGTAAVAIDPVGAPISLWQPKSHVGMKLTGEAGTFSGIKLLTDEPSHAARFYRDAFDWASTGDLDHFLLPDRSCALIGNAPSMPTRQRSLWLVTFTSDDLNHAAELAERLGATDLQRDEQGGLVFRDPAGALVRLASAPGTAAPPREPRARRRAR